MEYAGLKSRKLGYTDGFWFSFLLMWKNSLSQAKIVNHVFTHKKNLPYVFDIKSLKDYL